MVWWDDWQRSLMLAEFIISYFEAAAERMEKRNEELITTCNAGMGMRLNS